MTTIAPTLTRADLWAHIFGDQAGLMAVWSGQRIPDQKELADPSTRYFTWPSQAEAASRLLDRESAQGREAYVCAHLLTERRRVKDNAAMMLAAYVDGDGAQPGPDLPPPTATIESSPGRQQFYWAFTNAIDPKRAEQISRRLAYAIGADKSGWDLTQVLRAPGTRNWKYKPAPLVEIISIDDLAYDPDELERILPPLPAEAATRTEVKLERSAAAIPIGDRDQRARERMYTWQRGGELQTLANGGSVHRKPDGSPDHSADDLSYASGLAFALDNDPSRIAAEMWRSNRVRDKWSEIHSAGGQTYLEMTIGKAIASTTRTFKDIAGYDAGDQPVHIQITPPAPVVETPSTECPCNGEHAKCSEIRELRESNRDLMAWVERLAGTVEDLQTSNATLSIKLTRIQKEREIDRRTELAKGRVRQAFKAGQADAIIAVATIAPPIANTWKTDTPIITRAMVAEASGVHVATAGENLKVFDLDGSPVQRINKSLGQKDLTAYQLGGLTTPDILEQMADLGEQIKEQAGARPTTRAKRVRCERCPEGTTQTLAIICDGCGGLLEKRRIKPPPADNASETRLLEPTPPPVDDLRTTGTRNASVAGRAPDAPVSLADHRASLFDTDPETPHTVAVDVGPPERVNGRKTWRHKCDCGCRAFERQPSDPGPGERWRCDGCGHGGVMPLLAAVAGGEE